MKKIGICMRIEKFENSYKYFINKSYIDRLQTLNIQIVPLYTTLNINQQIQSLDALLIPGGYDIASFYLKQNIHPKCKFYSFDQDHFDYLWCQAFVEAKKPILGICRGMQIIASYFHSTLCQDFDINQHETTPHQHLIIPENNTIFTQLLSNNESINSYHHQKVESLSEDLILGAKSSDQTIEAFYHKNLPIYGVQWHPELLEHDFIIPYFCDCVLSL